jgi:ribonuclease HI
MTEIYTDGSCLKNPNGPGGWALCILQDKVDIFMSGSNKSTTNNRMELTAIIEALECIPKNKKCIIYTDSQLCINCATGKWCRKSNLDLWSLYDKQSMGKNIQFIWVKGHSKNYYNELVDKLAFKTAKSVT